MTRSNNSDGAGKTGKPHDGSKPEAATPRPPKKQPAKSAAQKKALPKKAVPEKAVPEKPTSKKPMAEQAAAESAKSQEAQKPANKQPNAEKMPVDKETKSPGETPAPPVSAGAPAPKRGGFGAAFVGGLVAAAVGFGASQYLGNENWPFSRKPSPVEQLSKVVAAQNTRIAKLEEGLAQLSTSVSSLATRAQVGDLDQRIAGAESMVEKLRASLAELDRRLIDLENRPVSTPGAPDEAVAAYERELQAMREMFQAELDKIDARQAETAKGQQEIAAQAQASKILATMAELRAALDSGKPFGDLVDKLSGLGVNVPVELATVSANGVPTLAELRESFPDFARSALLASARETVQSGKSGGITGFLRAQLGARSLKPREGDDPDAVLSRAEAATAQGDLARALAEIDRLPDVAKQEMATWAARARARNDAVTAYEALMAQQLQ